MDTRYQYWCVNEKDWIYQWITTVPTVCMNNAAHTINNVSLERSLEPGSRQIIPYEQLTSEQGTIDMTIDCVNVNATSAAETDVTWSCPFDIFLYEATIFSYDALSQGDAISITCNPNFNPGSNTVVVTSGSNTITVDDPTLRYIKKQGWYVVTITDGTNTEVLGRVTSIDRTTGTLTLENSTVNSYAIGSTIIANKILVNNYSLHQTAGGIKLLNKKVGGFYLPANTPVFIQYFNNNGIPKNCIIKLEYSW